MALALTACGDESDAPPPDASISVDAPRSCFGWKDEIGPGIDPYSCEYMCRNRELVLGADTGSCAGNIPPEPFRFCDYRFMTANYDVPGAGCCDYQPKTNSIRFVPCPEI
jgi:hypothetical protein